MSSGLHLDNVAISGPDGFTLAVDCRVGPGEVLALMGRSGIGKSTLLSFVTGSLAPDFRASGRVILDERDITSLPTHKRRIGILFQDDILFPHLSVGQNLAFGLSERISRADRSRLVAEALAQIGLAGYEGRDPATLSGGQASRVKLMRMLLSDPRALLLDEAFASLDAELRNSVRELVFTMAAERQLPVLMVTHDPDDARAAGGKIVHLGQD